MRRNGLFQPLMLATVLAVGFVVVWGLFGLWAVVVGEYVARGDDDSESLVFQDGTPLVASSSGRRGETCFRDLQGNETPAPKSKDDNRACRLPAHLPAPARALAWNERIRSFSDGRSPAIFWYVTSDGLADGFAYFVGFDSESNRCVGCLGTAGFRDGPPSVEERFPFSGPTSGEQAAHIRCAGQAQPRSAPQERARAKRRTAASPDGTCMFSGTTARSTTSICKSGRYTWRWTTRGFVPRPWAGANDPVLGAPTVLRRGLTTRCW